MLIGFLTIGFLGAVWSVREPVVLTALNPLHAVTFF
jgi:K+ transporter